MVAWLCNELPPESAGARSPGLRSGWDRIDVRSTREHVRSALHGPTKASPTSGPTRLSTRLIPGGNVAAIDSEAILSRPTPS